MKYILFLPLLFFFLISYSQDATKKLIIEMKKDKPNYDSVSFYIQNGANLNIDTPSFNHSYNGISHLHTSPLTFDRLFDLEDKFLILFIENGANTNLNIHFPPNYGMSVLTASIVQNRIEIIKVLIKKGENVNTKDKAGRIPIIEAVKKKNFELVKLLIKNGADVNAKDSEGFMPLNYAESELIKDLLISNKAVKVEFKPQLDEEDYEIKVMTLKAGYMFHGKFGSGFELGGIIGNKETNDKDWPYTFNGISLTGQIYTGEDNGIIGGPKLSYESVKYIVGYRIGAAAYFNKSTAPDYRINPEIGLSYFGKVNLFVGFSIPINHNPFNEQNIFSMSLNINFFKLRFPRFTYPDLW